jgi:hypothetical protein
VAENPKEDDGFRFAVALFAFYAFCMGFSGCERLAAMLADAGPALSISEHLDGDGAVIFEHACRLGLAWFMPTARPALYRMIPTARRPLKPSCSKARTFRTGGVLPPADLLAKNVHGFEARVC